MTLLFVGVFSLGAYAADVDVTSKVGTSKDAWHASGGPVTIDGISMPEVFGWDASPLGDVMWQEVAGLENGKYTVELWANARLAHIGAVTEDGQENCTFLYANNVEITIPVYHDGGLANNKSWKLEGVEVTDGVLKMGMTKKAAGSNWHTIQIKSLIYHASDAEALALAKAELQAALDEANAVSPKKDDFVAAIATAQGVYDASEDVEEVNAAIATLKAATKTAILGNASLDNPVLTDFVINGTFDAGTAPWQSNTGANNQGTATNQQGAFTGAFFENWHPSNYTGNLYQVIEGIPNGVYELSICAFVSTFKEGTQFVYANEDKVALTTGAPTAYKVRTNVLDNKIEVGFMQTEAINNWSGIDNVSLTYLGEKNVRGEFVEKANAFFAYVEGSAELSAMSGIKATYAFPLFDEIEPLLADIENVTDMAKLEALMTQIDEATAKMNEAVAAYKEWKVYSDLFWDAADNTAFVLSQDAADLRDMTLQNLNYFAAQATSVEAFANGITELKSTYYAYIAQAVPAAGKKFDMTFCIQNPDFENNLDGWTANKANRIGGEGYDAVGGIAEIGEWGATSWDASMSQTLNNLPNGKYAVKMAWMAATGIKMVLSANDASVEVVGIGDQGGNIANDGSVVEMGQGHRGWQYAEVEGLVVDGTLTITVSSSSATQYQWSNADAFELSYSPAVYPERSTADAPKFYTIASYNRGGVLTANENLEHVAVNENSYWYFTPADNNGGVYFCNLNGKYLQSGLTVGDTPGVWYILSNGVNEEGLAISSTNPISGGSCIDAHNYDAGVGTWQPSAGDWEGTAWVFAEVNFVKDIEALLEANADNHAEVPAVGQYTTAGYEALAAAAKTVKNPVEASEAIVAFEMTKNLPVFTIDGGAKDYVVGKSIYENEEGALKFMDTDNSNLSMLWAFDMTETTVGVTDRVVVRNVASGNLFWGANFIKVTETNENDNAGIADDGIFLFYTDGTGSPVHAQANGQTIVRWGSYEANSGSAWKFTFVGYTYDLKQLIALKSEFTAMAMEFAPAAEAFPAQMIKMNEIYPVLESVEALFGNLENATAAQLEEAIAAMEAATARMEEVGAVYAEYDKYVKLFKDASYVTEPATAEAAEALEYNMSGVAGMMATSVEAILEAIEAIKNDYLLYAGNAWALEEGVEFDLTFVAGTTPRAGSKYDATTDAWSATDYSADAPEVTTADGRTVQMIEYNTRVGKEKTNSVIMQQTVWNLPNGTYNVELYANAISKNYEVVWAEDADPSSFVYVSANDEKTPVVAKVATAIEESDVYAINGAVVTENSLHLTLSKNEVDGTNWHTVQVKSVRLVAPMKPVVEVTEIFISPTWGSLYEVGQTVQLTATINPEDAADKTLVWSSDVDFVTVDQNGLVTVVAPGEGMVTITATATNGVSGSCYFSAYIEDPNAITVTLNKWVLDIEYVGETFQLEAIVTPADAEVVITWSSSDETVATVDENGLVTAVGVGEADITVYVNGEEAGTCWVEVLNELPISIENVEAEVEAVIYDLSGRRVEKMTKGIYIVNGKKVIVK